ncbi:hypothetical protein ACIPSR_10845 [Pectobacterium sp. CHL-2024]|uniref:hypothetical protein n=1 Tax=Pectobacterium sp. CHL-2024 TaxID=3377079 RepID=UPI00382F0C09
MKNEKPCVKILLTVSFILAFFIIIGYAINFHDLSLSKNPADWGVLGDYFGGMLNPLISSITLFFLIKTYLTQKNELQGMEISTKKQLNISAKIVKINTLQTKISACYEILAVYHHEMDRVTESVNNGRKFIGMDGKEYYSDPEQMQYRQLMAKNINREREKINEYLNELND